MNKGKIILEYLKVIILTLLIALGLVLVTLYQIQKQVYKEQATIQKPEDDSIDYTLIGVLIEKNKYRQQQDPKNYKIDLKLAILYELKKDYKNALIEYKLAQEKGPYDDYRPQYRMACLYIKLNEMQEAQNVMDKIEEQPDKKLIGYKATVFQRLGDKYYSLGDYEDAIDKYQKALTYLEIIKLKSKIKEVKDSMASAHLYLADEYLNDMRVDDAINSLTLALQLVKAPILKYKLAILLMTSDPQKAYKYFDEVFKEAPNLINYDKYYKFLNVLADEAQENGDESQAELYDYKIAKLKAYYQSNVLSVYDLEVIEPYGQIKTNFWKNKYIITMSFRLKNTSNIDIYNLYLDVIFKNKDKVVSDYSDNFIDSKTLLKAHETSPIISVKTIVPRNNFEEIPNIIAEIHISKSNDTYKLLFGTVNIQQQRMKKKLNKFVVKFAKSIEKIMSKIPAFLY